MQPQKRKTTQAQKTSKKKKSNPPKPKTSRAPLAKSNRVTTPGRTTRIKHRELITSAMYPPAEWDLKVSELINPGNPDMFPWLSSVAICYEKYKFHKLHFEIIPYNPTTVLGFYTSAIDYDPNDPDPPSDEVLTAYAGCQSNNTWQKSTVVANTNALLDNRQSKYIDTTPFVSGKDYRQSAGGKFLFSVAGSSYCSVKIFVNYDVELFLPQLLDKALTTQGINHTFSKNSGTNVTEIVSSFINAPIASGSPVTLSAGAETRQLLMNFNRAGQYLVRLAQAGTGLLNPTISTGTNPYYAQNITTNGTTSFSNSFMLDVINPGQATVTWPTGTISTLDSSLITATRISELLGQIV